jgi:hypothetical protein
VRQVRLTQVLMLNDSSLPWGGLYDFNIDKSQWANPHELHRQGIVVDINNFRTQDADFEKWAARNFGVSPAWEPKPKLSQDPVKRVPPHYHVRILGLGQDH